MTGLRDRQIDHRPSPCPASRCDRARVRFLRFRRLGDDCVKRSTPLPQIWQDEALRNATAALRLPEQHTLGDEMGLLSKFEGKMEDTFEGAADKMANSPLSPCRLPRRLEKQMRRNKMVGAGKQYAPTLYTVLVNAGR